MNILLLLPILIISIPAMIGGIRLMKNGMKAVKEERRQKEKEAQLERDKQWFYNKVWNANWENEGEKIDIREIPQLSFEQWLIFYNSAPGHWEINLRQCDYVCTRFCAIPNYKKGKVYIDTFWETPEDLYKFMEWQKNEYQKGDAAIFENERAKRLSKLAKCLKEDIGEKNKQVQKELEALEKEVAANMPQKTPNDYLHNFLNFQKQVKENTFDKTKLEKICDERIMLSNGSIQCKETYIYLDANIFSKPMKLEHDYIYNIKKEEPNKEHIIHEEWNII